MLITRDGWRAYVGEAMLALGGRLPDVSIGDCAKAKVGSDETSKKTVYDTQLRGEWSRVGLGKGHAGRSTRIINFENATMQKKRPCIDIQKTNAPLSVTMNKTMPQAAQIFLRSASSYLHTGARSAGEPAKHYMGLCHSPEIISLENESDRWLHHCLKRKVVGLLYECPILKIRWALGVV